jgi:hypothetical protein
MYVRQEIQAGPGNEPGCDAGKDEEGDDDPGRNGVLVPSLAECNRNSE